MGHVALQHSPVIKKKGGRPLNVTFVKGIMGQFIQCDDEQKQKSGIKREREEQTSELVRDTIGRCFWVTITNKGAFTRLNCDLRSKVQSQTLKVLHQ